MTDNTSIPHVAIITIQGVVHQSLPNGQYHPKAVHADSFSINLFGNTLEECMENLKTKLEKIKKD